MTNRRRPVGAEAAGPGVPLGKMGSGKKWVVAEDCALVQAHMVMSQDPIRGTDQRSAEVWGGVYEAWCQLMRRGKGAKR